MPTKFLLVYNLFLLLICVREDAEKLRIHTLSEAGDLDSLEKMIDDISDSEYSPDRSSNAP